MYLILFIFVPSADAVLILLRCDFLFVCLI